MKRTFAIMCVAGTLALGPIRMPITAAEEGFYDNVKSSTVLIASFDYEGHYIARGSGFFVDEGVVITNIHVIDGAARYYRVFTTNDDESLNFQCYKDITRSDVKLNLEDDVAYLRVFINCPHGRVYFGERDPKIGEEIGIFGYPALGDKVNIVFTTGEVIAERKAGLKQELEGLWFQTNGKIHAGNSGGPIVQYGKVVGIAVAAHKDATGKSLDGFFIPVSQVRRGLEYANTSAFGYTPQDMQKNSLYADGSGETDPFNPIPAAGRVPSNADCRLSLGEGAEATGLSRDQGDGCRCTGGFRREEKSCVQEPPAQIAKESSSEQKPAPESRAEQSTTVAPTPTVPAPAPAPKQSNTGVMEERVCERVVRRFANDPKMWKRVTERVRKRFGFICYRDRR